MSVQMDLRMCQQSAHKSGHKTKTAPLSLTIDVHLTLARGDATPLLLLDQLAAFDKIDHVTPKMFEFLVWRWWHSFGMVQVQPL